MLKRDLRSISIECNVWTSCGAQFRQANYNKFVRQADKSEHWMFDDTKELLMFFKFANGTAVMFF